MDETTYRARLDSQDWGDVHARLLEFALARCGKKHESLADDLAQQAIARVYAYDSKWDPEQEPDLVRYLMSVVNSLLWNHRTSHATQRSASLTEDSVRRAAERVADPSAFSEDAAVEHDLFSRRLALLRERMADDPHALALLAALEQGLEPPAIRASTGWPASKLLAVRRRVLRAAGLVARDLGGSTDEPIDIEDEASTEEEEVA
jgi:DNA-directed RNA polymerase specialized sigma24 family protein